MGLEIITIIAILTLLAICLGVSFFWIFFIETATQITSNPTFFEVMVLMRSKAVPLMWVIFVITLVCGVILSVISPSRTEPYLLKIGLVSLILYLGSVIVKFAWLERIAIAAQSSLVNNLLLGFSLICITVSYWSFLHYALNPKI
ncbi:MAG: hypothetical protein AAGA80_04675 [Cyanobacteria bacterium P01_F01_bin.143]